MPRVLRVLCWTVVSVQLAYMIAANALLNFNLLPLAFAGTNQVQATVGSGWTVIPGRVHVSRVRVIFQDHNLQFSIDMQHGSMVVHLSELVHQKFHASHLRGEGVQFRMRNRVDPWDRHEPSVGTFPPIPEFPAPAVYEAYVPEPPIPDASYHLWGVHFDDVDVGVTELWAQAFRYTGKGRATGKFELLPARRLWVGPATLDLQPGLLSAGAYRIAPDLHGHVDCVVHPFDVRKPSGMQPLRWVSAHVRLSASQLDPQVYALFGSEPAPKVSSASGSLHLDIETQHGVITPQSRLEIVQRGFQLRAGQGDLDADRLELRAGAEGEGGFATLLIERGTVKEAIAPGYPPRIDHLELTVLSEHRDAARDFEFKAARLTEARIQLGDSSWLNRWLKGRNFALSGGSISLLAKGRYENGVIDGDAQLDSEGVNALVASQRVRYAGALSVRVERGDPEAFTGTAVADLTGRSLHAQLKQGQLDLAGLSAHLFAQRDGRGTLAHGEATLSNLSCTSPDVVLRAPRVIALADTELGPDGTLTTRFSADIPALSADGRGVRLTTVAKARGTFAQPKDKDEQRMEVWATLLTPRAKLGAQLSNTASTPRVDVHAALRTDARGASSGTIDLAPAAWRVDAGNMRFSGKSALTARLDALDLARHSGELKAQLTSTGVTLGDTTQNADCPWSRVQTLELGGTARLWERGSTTISMTGKLAQTELNWGDFLTRGDVGLSGHFEQGILANDGEGSLDLSLRNATLVSGGGGVKGWAATVPALDLRAELTQKAGKLSGKADLSAADARGRIGATRLSTDLSAQFDLDELNLAARTAHGSGAVHVRNAALPNVADPVSKWWADIKLDSLFGRAEHNLELGGTFRADLRDATPGLAVLASQGSLPKWVASAFPLNGLSVTGSLARRCRLTDIHLVNLSGGPALARGRLQSVPDGFQGALLLRVAGLQAVSAGLDFNANETHFGMFDGDAWLSRFDKYFDRQSDKALNLACPPDTNTCTEPEAVSVAAGSSSEAH